MIRPTACALVLLTAIGFGGGCSLRRPPTSSLEPQRATRAVRVNPANAHALYQLGRIALDEGRTGEAVGRFRAARAQEPAFEEAWNGEGIALLDDQSYKAAARHYAAMAEALPKSVIAIEGQAAAAIGLRQIDEAKSFAEAAIARDARSSQGYRILGEVAYIRGEYALASDNWRRALELNPGLAPTIRPTLDDLNGYLKKYGK